MSAKARLVLAVLVLVVLVVGVAAFSMGGFAFIFDAIEFAGHTVPSGGTL